ncbi:hypothetical protein F5884DRAFT_871580 [Xylogone sp. PMI_703]|nr:hypothetical protein F5884DRAFT_871580 [Xylogone sp. PMI_703]
MNGELGQRAWLFVARKAACVIEVTVPSALGVSCYPLALSHALPALPLALTLRHYSTANGTWRVDRTAHRQKKVDALGFGGRSWLARWAQLDAPNQPSNSPRRSWPWPQHPTAACWLAPPIPPRRACPTHPKCKSAASDFPRAQETAHPVHLRPRSVRRLDYGGRAIFYAAMRYAQSHSTPLDSLLELLLVSYSVQLLYGTISYVNPRCAGGLGALTVHVTFGPSGGLPGQALYRYNNEYEGVRRSKYPSATHRAPLPHCCQRPDGKGVQNTRCPSIANPVKRRAPAAGLLLIDIHLLPVQLLRREKSRSPSPISIEPTLPCPNTVRTP